MSIREFIKQNRKDIDECIKSACGNVGTLNDSDRREWIDNDEGLYNWASSEGVNV